jgi:5,10-methylene-tetrahydrofolate dehydrogenase/methenyl tetrahydrofolate cyclohydrolase
LNRDWVVHPGTGARKKTDFTTERFSPNGKAAVVIGTGGRANLIGEPYAFALANAGAKLVVVDLS